MFLWNYMFRVLWTVVMFFSLSQDLKKKKKNPSAFSTIWTEVLIYTSLEIPYEEGDLGFVFFDAMWLEAVRGHFCLTVDLVHPCTFWMESSEANGQTVLQLDFAKLLAPFSVSAMKRRAAVSKRLSFETTVFITHSRF